MSSPQKGTSGSIHAGDRVEVLEQTARAFATCEPLDYEYRIIARDGSVLWMHDRGTFVFDDDREAVQWRDIMMDVTARKQAELALAHAEGQLRHAQRMDVVGRLAGGIAHDFNTFSRSLRAMPVS
ncbi:MAG: PAS domain-containing protein [Gemmatimonadaceae bacterium]|nr:PAS domain-containing protein [Gemmatimonadaceae bacterium]